MDYPSSNELFHIGERLAGEFLERDGYSVRERNFREKCGEIDLIATKGDLLVFVEVKTRSHHSISDALANVSLTKQRRITRTAVRYLNRNPELCNHKVRFDVIVVFYYKREDTYSLRHFPDAFLPVPED